MRTYRIAVPLRRRIKGGSLARECAKLDRRLERALAEEGLKSVAEWPPY